MAEDLKVEAQKLIDEKVRERKIQCIVDMLGEKECLTKRIARLDEKIKAVEEGSCTPFDEGERRY